MKMDRALCSSISILMIGFLNVPVFVQDAQAETGALTIASYLSQLTQVQTQSKDLDAKKDALQAKVATAKTLSDLDQIGWQQTKLQIKEDDLQTSLELSPSQLLSLISQSFSGLRNPCGVRLAKSRVGVIEVEGQAFDGSDRIAALDPKQVSPDGYVFSSEISSTTGGLSIGGSGVLANNETFSVYLDLNSTGAPTNLMVIVGSASEPNGLNVVCTGL